MAIVASLLLAFSVAARAQNVSMVRVTQTTAVLENPVGTANAVGTATPGDVLEVLDQRDGWYLVRPPAGATASWRTGWVNGASVTAIPEAQTPRISTSQPAPSTLAPRSKPRKGFIIGVGGGAGLHHFKGQYSGYSYNGMGLATNVLIGYAPTDQLLIYYANYLQLTNSSSPYDLIALSGVGATYLAKPTASSWYVNGAIGAATGASASLKTGTVSNVDRGLAVDVGAGYEFARHWFLGGDVTSMTLESVRNTALRGTITWIFY
jgi:Bacterial SH3 domain